MSLACLACQALRNLRARTLTLSQSRWQSTVVTGTSKDVTDASDETVVDGEHLQDTIVGVQLAKSSYNASLLNALSLQNASAPELRKVRKQGIIEKYRRSESDTGSPEVQIALMSHKIKDLTAHMIKHRNDKMKKRSMMMAVSQRRRMMMYLLKESPERYMTLVKELEIRPNSVFGVQMPRGAKKHPTRVLSFADVEGSK